MEENKSKVKKIVLIAVLVIIIAVIVFVVINASSGKKEQKVDTNSTTVSKVAQSDSSDVTVTDNAEKKDVKVTELDDGKKYSVTENESKPEIVIGDNYYGTQLNDINLNFDKYDGKTIEIEGLYFQNMTYTFVGRYSTTNVCADCPTGFSYFEYEWKGKEGLELKDSETWMKINGTLRKGNDGVEYYYIDADSIEIMNQKGMDTVSN